MKVSKSLIAILVVVAVWAYFGFPSPDTLLHLVSAKDECAKFARDNKDQLFMNTGEIKAVDSWIKNGKIVVEIGEFKTGSTTYTSRLCVLGGGQIRIVSILEAGAWR